MSNREHHISKLLFFDVYIYIVRELYVFYLLFRKLFHAPSACGIVFVRRIQRLWVSYPFSFGKKQPAERKEVEEKGGEKNIIGNRI